MKSISALKYQSNFENNYKSKNNKRHRSKIVLCGKGKYPFDLMFKVGLQFNNFKKTLKIDVFNNHFLALKSL